LNELYDFFYDGDKYEKQLRASGDYVIDFYDLYLYNADVAMALLNDPKKVIETIKGEYLPEKEVLPGVIVSRELRVKNLVEPINIRDIESIHINKFIQVECIVVTASIPESTITEAVYECPKCGARTTVTQIGFEEEKPFQCVKPCYNKRGFKLLVDESEKEDTQIITLQERPEELPPGEIPEPLTAILRGTLTRAVTPGDRVKATGIIIMKKTKRSGLDYMKILQVNHIEALNRNHVEMSLTDEDEHEIMELSQRPDVESVLINSFAPGIYGWWSVKQGLLTGLFGGVRKKKGGIWVRGDNHILMAGDPGTGKTVMLQFAKEVSPRGVYDTGRGVTGVGLTAALKKEDDRFVLAAGSMALADMGVLCLDEFEKMNKEDREVIHVPLEQQIIPISKGGLKTTLNSRCAVLGACNPTEGRYNTYLTIPQNVKDFPPSLLSRFDLIFIMVDRVNAEQDERMANRMLGLDEDDRPPMIPMEFLKKYIAYSKNVKPKIPREVKKHLKEYYKRKRKEKQNEGGIQLTPRQLESLERLTEARARMHLRAEASMEDAEKTIELFEIYVNETWKDPYTGKIDLNVLEGLPPDSRNLQVEALPSFIQYLQETGKGEEDLQGWYISRGDLVDAIMDGSNIDRGRANDIIQIASDKDLIWFSAFDKIRQP